MSSMTRQKLCRSLALALVAAATLPACSPPGIYALHGSPGVGASSTGGSVGSATGSGGGPGFTFTTPDGSAGPAIDPDAGCGAESAQAMRVDLDLLLLVDVSSSMANVVAGGTQTKWQIAHDAVLGFLRAQTSAGLNVALQFFPLGSSCALPDYERLAVPFGQLPTNVPALAAALDRQDVRMNFGTPTGAAMIGVLNSMRAYEAAHPGHRGVVLMVTDGEPTACTPITINDISLPIAAAAQMTPAIPTYVIGVFTPAELTRVNDTVAKLAMAGGTSAFILSAVADLPMRLADALNQVRNVAIPCEFTLPMPVTQKLDYGRVNVHLQRSAGGEDLPYVGSPDRCSPSLGGWYYDVDPATGGKPTRVRVCDNICSTFKADPNTRVDLVFGCATVVIR
jgi:hypothetical protein